MKESLHSHAQNIHRFSLFSKKEKDNVPTKHFTFLHFIIIIINDNKYIFKCNIYNNMLGLMQTAVQVSEQEGGSGSQTGVQGTLLKSEFQTTSGLKIPNIQMKHAVYTSLVQFQIWSCLEY